MTDTINGFPLTWPTGWKRTRTTRRSPFGSFSVASSLDQLLAELRRMQVESYNVIVSTNIELRLDGLPYSNRTPPRDTGAAVWFKLKGERVVLACDRWDKVADNLRAITKHIGAIRGQERWGVGTVEQAFTAYKAIPASTSDRKSWWTVLGFTGPMVDRTDVKSRYRDLVKRHHPDQGGNAQRFQEIHEAYTEALR